MLLAQQTSKSAKASTVKSVTIKVPDAPSWKIQPTTGYDQPSHTFDLQGMSRCEASKREPSSSQNARVAQDSERSKEVVKEKMHEFGTKFWKDQHPEYDLMIKQHGEFIQQ